MSDIDRRHNALIGLAGEVNAGLADVTVTVKRPDPRLASSWCREGVTHDHGACGGKWNNHDPREIAEAARFADDLGEERRRTEAATEAPHLPNTAALASLLREAEQRMVAEVGIAPEDAALTVGALGNLVIRWLAEHLGGELDAYDRGWRAAAAQIAAELQERIPATYPPEAEATRDMQLQRAKVQGAWRDAASVALEHAEPTRGDQR
jgi:hypothetical protein